MDSKKILVVDDDLTIHKLLKTRLEAALYHVITAGDGQEGLVKFKKERPDLILLDVMMPNMDGYTFVQEFKKIGDLRTTPIIMVTAQELMEEIFRVEGINDYIVKPFQMENLLQKVEKHLRSPDRRILVVDDAVEVVQLLESVLSDRGYRVSTAFDGLEGLTIAKREIPDLIILDVMMPKLDGYRLCRIIKFDERYKKIAVILLSARTEQEDKILGQQVGADIYLDKPFLGETLLQKIKELLWD